MACVCVWFNITTCHFVETCVLVRRVDVESEFHGLNMRLKTTLELV